MIKFIGREKEIEKLNTVIGSSNLTLSLIYGRKHVGKTELVKQVLKDTNFISISYQCREVAEKTNVLNLSEILGEALGMPTPLFNDMSSLLEYIFKLSIEKKIVLVLDEYPFLRQSTKGIDSILQALIDKYRDTASISIILLGSYIEIMKSLLSHSNPLYGRVDLTINLKQMDYYDSSLFYPNYSNEDKVRIYSVFGGIPYYNRLIDDTKTVKENIISLIASIGARLENEVLYNLKGEIAKITNANEVFEALAKGYNKYSDILDQSHVSSGPTLVDVLDKLMSMEIVTKVNPINDLNKKKARYYIVDNLTSFYYRYIYKYASQLNIMDSDIFYDMYIKEDFESKYVPYKFEEIVKQYLIKENIKGKFKPVLENIGKYYYDDPINHTNGEFDVVSLDSNGYIFYEVKFRKAPITNSIINEEINQVIKTGLNCYKYVFISRTGFNCDKLDNVELIHLDALYTF